MWHVACRVKRQAQLIARFNQNCIVVLGLYRTGDCCLLYVVWQSDCQLECGLSTRNLALPLCGVALSLVDKRERWRRGQ